MGGGGSIGAANSSLKYNRSLVGKRQYKDVKTILINSSGKTELEFKQLSTEELHNIKHQIRLKARQKRKQSLFLMLGLFIILATSIAAVIL